MDFFSTQPDQPKDPSYVTVFFLVENTAIISIYLVVDVLAEKEAPNTLVTHPVVLASLLRTWKLGPSSREAGSPVLGRILQQLRSFSAPR